MRLKKTTATGSQGIAHVVICYVLKPSFYRLDLIVSEKKEDNLNWKTFSVAVPSHLPPYNS